MTGQATVADLGSVSGPEAAHLAFDTAADRSKFDAEPFGFSHTLHTHPLLKFDALVELARLYAGHTADYFVAASAPSPGTVFFSVDRRTWSAEEALARLNDVPTRVLLKRPERHDPRYRHLLNELFSQVVKLRGDLDGERVVRLESSVFVTSAASTTPFHFDPEVAFFTQIEGEKIYHVYAPEAVSEPDLEKFYLQGQVNIGQIDLGRSANSREYVFRLSPGSGLHQPQNSPHWVETGTTRSISYSFVFETDVTRRRGRARAYNYYLRKLGISPTPTERRSLRDRIKSECMRPLIPLRNGVRSTLRTILRR